MQAGGWGGLCYQTNPSGVMACSFPRIFFLILSPLQVLLSQSQEADRASWVMLRLDGSEQDVCLQPFFKYLLNFYNVSDIVPYACMLGLLSHI